MKATTLLTVVFSVLAAKVKADCFATQLGYPCCTKTKDVVLADQNGQWGVEDNHWCGIDNTQNATQNPWEQQEQQQQQENNNVTPVGENYMDKLQVSNTCPINVRTMQSDTQYPTAQKITYFSKITNSERRMNIILPVGYTESKKYPVIYYLHGILGDEDSMIDESTFAIPANLLKEGKIKEFIMVLPSEYAPTPGTEVEPGFTQQFFDGYDNFINELVDVIMPYMEEHYSILTGKDNTAVCGFSMGGRNSLYIAYKRPDLFGYVGAFSPAPGVTPGDDFSGHHPGLFTEDGFRADVPPYVTLISCGTNDSVVHDFPKSYHEILTRNNQKHIWFEVPGADHDYDAISAGLYNFLQTTFGSLNN